MASTARRWMNVSDLRISNISFNDAMGASVGSEAQPVGSNSEKDSHANRFLQGVQLSQSVAVRTHDLAGAKLLMNTKLGKGVGLTFKLCAATESSGLTDITASATSPLCFVQSVSMPGEKDQLGMAEINLIMKTSDGTSFGLSLS